MSNNAEVKYSGKPETFSFLKKSKSSPDPCYFIFEINFGKRRIRHRRTLNLNDDASSIIDFGSMKKFIIQFQSFSFDFASTHAFSTPVISNFWSVFIQNHIPSVAPVITLVSTDVEFSYTSFGICEKLVASCPPTPTPTQK